MSSRLDSTRDRHNMVAGGAMRTFPRVVARIALLIAGMGLSATANAATLCAGHRLLVEADLAPNIAHVTDAVLKISFERLPNAPLDPLALEVRLPDLDSSADTARLTTFSFYGVPLGQVTTFEEPLSADAVRLARGGKLLVELRLRTIQDGSSAARIHIRQIVVAECRMTFSSCYGPFSTVLNR